MARVEVELDTFGTSVANAIPATTLPPPHLPIEMNSSVRRFIGACFCVHIAVTLFRLSAIELKREVSSSIYFTVMNVAFNSSIPLVVPRAHENVSEPTAIEPTAAPQAVAGPTELKSLMADQTGTEKVDPPKSVPVGIFEPPHNKSAQAPIPAKKVLVQTDTPKNITVLRPAPSPKRSELQSSFDKDVEAVKVGMLEPFKLHSMFGFLSTVSKQPKATLKSISSITAFMPKSPIYMCSSAGFHYEPLAERFPNIRYVYDDINAATWLPEHKYTKNDAKGLERWFERVKVAALWCNCTYLINMEDDTILRDSLLEKPEHDAGGVVNNGFRWAKELQEKFGADKWSYESHGMCGGSYIRTEAFLDAYSRINWTRVAAMSAIDRRIGFDPDVTLAMLMMDSGYTLRPWKDLGQKYHRGSAKTKILHAEKKYYGKQLFKHDGAVISDTLEHNVSEAPREQPNRDASLPAMKARASNTNLTNSSDVPKEAAVVTNLINSEPERDFEEDLVDIRSGNLSKFEKHSLFGFMFTGHKQPKATLKSVQSVTSSMPKAPIYFCASAGYHYDPLAKRYGNMHYVYDHINAATWLPSVRKTDDVRNLERWFERIKVAATWCNCDYLVYMEDDTLLRKRLDEKPEHDAGGMPHPDFHWVQGIQDKFGAGNWSYESHGMCGGSYVRTEAFLEAYSRINWTRIGEMKAIDELIGRHSDITLAMLMMDSGYILRPWKEVARKYHRGSKEAKLLHAEKKFYDKPLVPSDGPVISDRLDRNESTRVGLVY